MSDLMQCLVNNSCPGQIRDGELVIKITDEAVAKRLAPYDVTGGVDYYLGNAKVSSPDGCISQEDFYALSKEAKIPARELMKSIVAGAFVPPSSTDGERGVANQFKFDGVYQLFEIYHSNNNLLRQSLSAARKGQSLARADITKHSHELAQLFANLNEGSFIFTRNWVLVHTIIFTHQTEYCFPTSFSLNYHEASLPADLLPVAAMLTYTYNNLAEIYRENQMDEIELAKTDMIKQFNAKAGSPSVIFDDELDHGYCKYTFDTLPSLASLE